MSAAAIPSHPGILRYSRLFHGLTARLFGCFCLIAVATFFGGTINDRPTLWIANGVLLAYLLLAPRRLWPAYLAVGLLAHIAVAPWTHTSWSISLLFAPHDLLMAALAAMLLRRRSTDLPDFTNPFYLLRFAACALLVAPLIVSCVYAAAFSRWLHTSFLLMLGTSFLSDSLGLLVTTPATVAVFRARREVFSPASRDGIFVILVVAVCAAILGQHSFIGPSLLIPLLVFVLLRFGLGWASLATLVSTVVSAWYTTHGIGPFAHPLSTSFPGLHLQGFIISIMIVLYSVSVVLENLRKTERRLLEIANIHALVAENSRDVILLLDFEGRKQFISAPDRFWGGWSRDELLKTGLYEIVHPEDQKSISALLAGFRDSKDGALLEVRVRRKDNTYAWIEANLRTVRDPISHLPQGILANLREISERKYAEKQLEDAYHAVEALAVTDALTGLANRRRFDNCLAAEWRRALREQKPLSLLIIDVDNFKDFNDTYGHTRGDICLKEIASAIRNGASRASDLSARFGGEEFAVILPNTKAAGARRLGNIICERMRGRALAHARSSVGIVTVSVGCATVIPQPGQQPVSLIDLADQALYAAKSAGRNCVYPPTSAAEETSPDPQIEELGLA